MNVGSHSSAQNNPEGQEGPSLCLAPALHKNSKCFHTIPTCSVCQRVINPELKAQRNVPEEPG